MVDIFFLTILLATSITSYVIYFRAKEKAFFLILGCILMLISGYLVLTTQVTMSATTQPYTLMISSTCNATNMSNQTCSYQNQVVPAQTVLENVSFPSFFETGIAILFILFGLFLGFKAISLPKAEFLGTQKLKQDQLE